MNKKVKFLAAVLGVIILLVAAGYYFVPTEWRMFALLKVSPGLFKKVYFHKLKKKQQNIYMVGTTHRHLGMKDYSLLHLKAVIKNLEPDLLLVESRPEQIKKGNLADGPLEMLYCHLVARSRGIEVKGVDWWTIEKAGKPGTTFPERDDKIVNNILEAVKGHKKVLVLLGASHILEGVPRLKQAGYNKVPFSFQEKEELFVIDNHEFKYPSGMKRYVKKRLELNKQKLNQGFYEDEVWREKVKALNESLKSLINEIERVGEKET